MNDLQALYHFGSLARGQGRPDSDVDLAFLGPAPLDPYRVFMAAQDLAILLDRDVDLCDLRAASTVLRVEVIGNGIRIYTGDRDEVDTFEMYALSDYARLNEERAVVLKAFEDRYRGR